VHPTAGAVAIGARPFLVAYNVYLGPSSNLAIAKEVAKAVRGSSGGLRYVKAMGFEVDGQAQVSMNLVDTDKTPLYRAFDTVKMEAEAKNQRSGANVKYIIEGKLEGNTLTGSWNHDTTKGDFKLTKK